MAFTLEIICFKFQSCCFFKSKHQVHILYCLSRCTFQQVVDDRVDHQFSSDFLQLDQTFIRIYNLLQKDRCIAHMCESSILIKVIEQIIQLCRFQFTIDLGTDKNSSCKISSPWYKAQINFCICL